MQKIIGVNYLHRHPGSESRNGIDIDHVIVDRNQWEEVVKFFQVNPDQFKQLRHDATIQLSPTYFVNNGFVFVEVQTDVNRTLNSYFERDCARCYITSSSNTYVFCVNDFYGDHASCEARISTTEQLNELFTSDNVQKLINENK